MKFSIVEATLRFFPNSKKKGKKENLIIINLKYSRVQNVNSISLMPNPNLNPKSTLLKSIKKKIKNHQKEVSTVLPERRRKNVVHHPENKHN